MQVMVTFRHVNPSQGLRSYATEKVERLDKFARRIVDAHVTLSVEKQRHQAEIQLFGKDLALTAKEETGDLYAAIDLALAKLERQLKRLADKRKSRKGGISTSASAAAPEAAPRRRSRLRAKRVAVKPMSVEDAIERMEQSEDGFLLFRNDATDLLNVMYRQKDGSFGLLEPEPS
jgi:putative sigma-54 modulation protein